MALTFTRVPDGEDIWGRTRVRFVDITLDNSYPLTNGYVINAQDVGMKGIFGAKVIGGNKASGAILPTIDLGTVAGAPPTSAILRAFLPTGGASAPATLTAPIVSGGAGASTLVAGIGKEVGNTTDMTSIIIRVMFIGR